MTTPNKLELVLAELQDRGPSLLTHHRRYCCELAESWFCAMATSLTTERLEPFWMTERWRWGPTPWPLAWCEAVRREELDCGALAHLAAVAIQENGRSVARVQLVKSSSVDQVEHWAARWARLKDAARWIWGDLVYHEVVGVLSGSDLRIWDPAEGSWLDRGSGQQRLRAIKVVPNRGSDERSYPLRWDGLELSPLTWHLLD